MKNILISFITLYQKGFSFLWGPRCRFYPSCSQYTKESIQAHGSLRGIFFGIKRLLKCHPFHAGGYDPVPTKEFI